MELISVIMPYYKKKFFVKSAINSILSQTYKKFELIIIYDDEDQTELKLLKKISIKDKRIKLLINKKNIGAGQSRNKAIEISKGKYLAFIDSDDLWVTKKLEKQYIFMKKNNYCATHTSYKIINSNNRILAYRKARDFKKLNSLLKSCDIGLSTVLIKKKILGKKLRFANLKTKEDFVLWLKILNSKNEIMSLDEPLTKWRKLENSLSSSIFQKLIDGFSVYNKYMKINVFKSLYFVACLSLNFIRK
jgi:teichuronic acid biosynthesis glycosyltransferase TuaG